MLPTIINCDLRRHGQNACKLVGALLALAYLATALQFALLPTALMEQLAARNADFPCAGHSCGCQTAAQCQSSCCCFPKAKPAASSKSCCSSEKAPAPEPTPEIIAGGCMGAKAILELTSKRLAPVRIDSSPQLVAIPDGKIYGIAPISTFSPVVPDVATPVPICPA